MPATFAAHPLRRPLMLLAAWLVALQAFLAGVATAQAAAMSVADPLAVVCHGVGGSGGDPSDPADAGKVRHLCCAACLSAAPALIAPAAPAGAPAQCVQARAQFLLERIIIVLARGVIRAGPSQGPPSLA